MLRGVLCVFANIVFSSLVVLFPRLLNIVSSVFERLDRGEIEEENLLDEISREIGRVVALRVCA